nr:MAG TPA: hypothetical protein [Caudoviricetes sp.]
MCIGERLITEHVYIIMTQYSMVKAKSCKHNEIKPTVVNITPKIPYRWQITNAKIAPNNGR